MSGRCLAAVAAVSLVAAGVSNAAAPKPWQWAPARVSFATGALCRGVGVSTVGRYSTFRCTIGSKVIWAKVRRSGTGRLCIGKTLATIPKACLKTT
jgi:hypothetical protein